MANDFKRMWTKEELKDTYYLPRYIENETIHIDEKTFNSIKKHNTIAIYDDIQSWVYYHLTSSTINSGDTNETHIFIADTNVLRVNKENNEYTIEQIISEYVSVNTFESLVRETPTDVSIIEDQGKLELMLEHDGNVLAVNDTPNQFLQRRLDKPSEVINDDYELLYLSQTFQSLYANGKIFKGQIVEIEDNNDEYWNSSSTASNGLFIVVDIQINYATSTLQTLTLKPLNVLFRSVSPTSLVESFIIGYNGGQEVMLASMNLVDGNVNYEEINLSESSNAVYLY